MLLIGVDNNNIIQGVTINNAKRSAIQNSLNEINPPLPTAFYSVEVQGKTIWVIEVNSGTQKPYALSGAIYVRQGPNTQKLTSVEQMRDFFQQSDRIYFDEAPCTAFRVENDLDNVWFEEFRIEAGLSKAISRQQIIQNLKLLLPNGNMKNGGVLFFGLFVRIDMVEQIGSGINRMRYVMKEAKLRYPDFKTDGMFTVVLHRTVEETVEKILNAIKENPKLTARDLQKITGLSKRGVEYQLDKLKKENMIDRTGSTKAGQWVILKKYKN